MCSTDVAYANYSTFHTPECSVDNNNRVEGVDARSINQPVSGTNFYNSSATGRGRVQYEYECSEIIGAARTKFRFNFFVRVRVSAWPLLFLAKRIDQPHHQTFCPHWSRRDIGTSGVAKMTQPINQCPPKTEPPQRKPSRSMWDWKLEQNSMRCVSHSDDTTDLDILNWLHFHLHTENHKCESMHDATCHVPKLHCKCLCTVLEWLSFFAFPNHAKWVSIIWHETRLHHCFVFVKQWKKVGGWVSLHKCAKHDFTRTNNLCEILYFVSTSHSGLVQNQIYPKGVVQQFGLFSTTKDRFELCINS